MHLAIGLRLSKLESIGHYFFDDWDFRPFSTAVNPQQQQQQNQERR